jgi:cob(I)alamin adenosyltransferase
MSDKVALKERVRDGLCSYRLSSTYKEGGGDTGLSQAGIGIKLSKDDPTYKLHSLCEELRILLSKSLLISSLSPLEKEVLLWIRNSTFSVSSFCYCGGSSTNHTYPIEFLNYIETYIKNIKAQIGGAQDFIIWEDIGSLILDGIRVKVREIEALYVLWAKDSQGVEELIDRNGKVLNRMSTYFFWLTRAVACRSNKEEVYWTGKMESFPIEF